MTYFLHQFDIFEVLKEGEESHDRLLQLHKQNGQTIIYVTHDQQEAMALGDRIAVINDGKIQMIETPDKLYRHPANLFVARFVGTPQINTMPVRFSNQRLISEDGTVVSTPKPALASALKANDQYTLGIRPENIQLHDDRVPDSFPVEVGVVVDYGRYKQLTCRAFDNQRLKVVVNQWPVRPGKIAYATFEASAILLFDPKTNVNVIDSQPDYVLE